MLLDRIIEVPCCFRSVWTSWPACLRERGLRFSGNGAAQRSYPFRGFMGLVEFGLCKLRPFGPSDAQGVLPLVLLNETALLLYW
ncbi:hypothetical protein M513_00440 [Trichuris suis]|uniref:Uncharacterized protein n=1 Tax=Trichuris suis TaxID=68888 RepID=A0A085MNF1_9BILA|nr:hypothetical protein M513_00440 [Trichuris suis]